MGLFATLKLTMGKTLCFIFNNDNKMAILENLFAKGIHS